MIDWMFFGSVMVIVIILMTPVVLWVYWNDIKLFFEKRKQKEVINENKNT